MKKTIVIVIVAILAGVCMARITHSDTNYVRVRKIDIVNAQDKVIMTLGHAEERPVIVMYGPDQQILASIMLNSDGEPWIRLANGKGVDINIVASAERGASFLLQDHKDQIMLNVKKGQLPSISVSVADKIAWHAPEGY